MYNELDEVLRKIHEATIKAARYNIEGEIVVIVSYDYYTRIKQEVQGLWGLYLNTQDNQETRLMGARLLTSGSLKGYEFKVFLELN